MSGPAYQALAIQQATLPQITSQFGSTASPSQLQGTFGPNWLQTFLRYQVAGESCVYYLSSDKGTSQAYQLCFNRGNVLVDKAVISAATSGG